MATINLTQEELTEKVSKVQPLLNEIRSGMEQVIRGKSEFITKLLTCFLADGHLLIEDVPGTGKTTAAKTLEALVSGLVYKRIQFTPDLLPYDITGVDVWDVKEEAFVFQKGPIFCQILLADEINRTTPKVQSALLEVMAEKQVTVGNKTWPLSPPFFVLATQNPVEMDGTYPLPAAQLDRFTMKISLGYPDPDDEYDIVRNNPSARVLPGLKKVLSRKQILDLQNLATQIHCDDSLIRCAVDIATKSRNHKHIRLGVSTRGVLMLINTCRAYALIQGREYVTDQDLSELAPLVYSHRMILRGSGRSAEEIIREVIAGEIAHIKH